MLTLTVSEKRDFCKCKLGQKLSESNDAHRGLLGQKFECILYNKNQHFCTNRNGTKEWAHIILRYADRNHSLKKIVLLSIPFDLAPLPFNTECNSLLRFSLKYLSIFTYCSWPSLIVFNRFYLILRVLINF